MTNPFFNDPANPDRPQHPDFWRLVDCINRIDGDATEGGLELEQLLAGVDLRSAIYMGGQRLLRVLEHSHLNPSDRQRAAMMSLWLDGLALGMRYAQHPNTPKEAA